MLFKAKTIPSLISIQARLASCNKTEILRVWFLVVASLGRINLIIDVLFSENDIVIDRHATSAFSETAPSSM